MSQERSLDALRAEIDQRLETVLESPAGGGVTAARETIDESDDRWYGLLLALSYDSVAETSDTGRVVPAATVIELLRGYCRLRGELLIRLNDTIAHSSAHDPTSALLAGDYLHSAAYSRLSAVDHAPLEDCFETLTTVSETITEAFSSSYTQSTSSATSHRSYIDETAGVLGEGAAVMGATLAGTDSTLRDSFAVLGRGLSTSRQIQRALDPAAGALPILPPESDEQRLRQHAEQRLDDADQALSDLSSTADVKALRAFGASGQYERCR